MSEDRRAYRSLQDPTRLVGLSAGQWLVLLALSGALVGWFELGLLSARLSVTVAAVLFGLPAGLAFLWQGEGLPVRILVAGIRRRGLRGRRYESAPGRGPRRGVYLAGEPPVSPPTADPELEVFE